MRAGYVVRAVVLSSAALAASGCGLISYPLRDGAWRLERPAIFGESDSPVLEAYCDRSRTRLAIHYSTVINKPFEPLLIFPPPGHPLWTEEEVGRGDTWLNVDLRELRRESLSEPRASSEDEREWPPATRWLYKQANAFIVTGERAERWLASDCRWPLADLAKLEVAVRQRSFTVAVWEDLDKPGDIPAGTRLGVLVFKDMWNRWRRNGEDKIVMADVVVCFPTDFPKAGGGGMVMIELPHRKYKTSLGRAGDVLRPVAVTLDIVTSPVQFVGLLLYAGVAALW